jgi:single-strand DNA-binding protein
MYQRIELIGRLGRDPEMRYTGEGKPVANFSIVTSENYKDRNGEKQEKATWWKIVAWEKLAEIIQQYVKKGQLVFIAGVGQNREWQDKEGNKRTSFEVTARELKMLGGGKRDESHAPAERPAPAQSSGTEIDDSDLPF